jgi:biopolymer transport protein ExbD
MRQKQRSQPPAHIFIGSMADVSFLLVIFFIVTSVIVAARGLDFNLDSDTGEVGDDSIDVHVQADGQLIVDRRPLVLAQLLPYVGSKLEQDPQKPVIVRTEPDAPYSAMMVVLDELRQAPEKAGFEVANLAIPTYREMNQGWINLGWAGG